MAATAKIAISINKQLLTETNRIARQRKISRSRVVSQALEEMVRRERDDQVTETLNKVYSTPPTREDKKAMRFLSEAGRRSAMKSSW